MFRLLNGGLDMAVEEFFGAETAWHCEFEAAPSKILATHWDVPNHHDLTKTDWSTVEPVDIVTAGWPCQPWSAAGAQKGEADERAIWPSVADAIRRLRPRTVVLENVPAIIVLGELARAVGDLAAFGYDAQWQCVRASDVGAPHKRERCFILATNPNNPEWWTTDTGRCDLARHNGVPAERNEGRGPRGVRISGAARAATSNANRIALRQQPEPIAQCGGEGFAGQFGAEVAWGNYGEAIERWTPVVGRPAPRPTEPGRNGERLSPLLVEWMMGLPAGWVTDVDITRNEKLKALGNGVVPQQALAALGSLSQMAVAA